MRKIPNNIENQLDNILIDLSDKVSPFFYKYKFTPNEITTLSLLTSIFSTYLFFKEYYYMSAFFYLVGYFFDCLDGYYARKYNMETEFGDYYDHVSDNLKLFLVLWSMYSVNYKKFTILLPIIILFGVLSIIHLGCQEKYYNNSKTTYLSILKNICPANDDNILNTMKITKYGGCGTFNLFIALCIISYKY